MLMGHYECYTQFGQQEIWMHILHAIPLLTHVLHFLIGVHKFKQGIENFTETFKQGQKSTEPSVGPLSVPSLTHLPRLHPHEASPALAEG